MIPVPPGLPVALSLVGYNALLTGFFVLFKRRDRVAAHFLFANLFTAGWGIGLSFLFNLQLAPGAADLWGRIAWVCFFLMPVAWFHFVLIYTGATARRKTLGLCYLFTFFFLAFMGSVWMIPGFRDSGGLPVPVTGPAFKALTVLYFTVLAAAFLELHGALRRETSMLRRADFRFLFMTQFAGYSLASLTLLPVYGIFLPQFQLLVLPLWQFFLAYALVQHHLLDMEELARTLQRDHLAAMATVAASMHHELRNPLTAIRTFAEYLPEKYDDPEFRATFKSLIPEEVARICSILDQMLEFARPRDPEIEPLDAASVIRETLELFRSQIEKAGVQVVCDFEDPVLILADRSQLRQILLNLLLNSIQAMPLGGSLNLALKSAGRDRVLVQVIDSGKGISEQDQKRVFAPFFSTKEKGTGLGLYIVKQLVERNQGVISLESSEGRGTTLRLVFKRAGVSA